MTTGYTYIIEEKEDLTLREFTLRCARAFGACVEQRDDSVDVLPRIPEPSTYHLDAIQREKARLLELKGTTSSGREAIFNAECDRHQREGEASIAKCKITEKRYMAMRDKVLAWEPPSPEHEGLKKFMLEQIDLCASDWEPYVYDLRSKSTPEKWFSASIEAAEESIAYHQLQHDKEVKRYAEKKEWIASLYECFEDEQRGTS